MKVKNRFSILPGSTKHLLIALSLTIWLSLSSALALGPAVKDLVKDETKANAVSVRNDQMIPIEHYDIPSRLLKKDFARRLPAKIRDALVFKRDGKEYVRWIINPEDTVWHLELEQYLKDNGVKPVRKKFFQGYQTASRSYIVENPRTKAQFSLKVSTNKTGGNWTNKKQEAADAFDARRSMDYVVKVGEKRPYEHFKLMDEPAAFGIEKIDQGMLVRELGELPKGKFRYLPGFSAVHDERGMKIAHMNGAMDPAAFWNEHYNKPLARALAELSAKTGIAYDSPHSQNFLIELDSNYKPTGKIILRDLGDIFITPEIAIANKAKALVDSWPKENVTRGEIKAYVGILHGNTFPSWISDTVYDKWGKDFYEEYGKEFSRQTGIPLEKLPSEHGRSGRYFTHSIDVTGPEWKDYMAQLKSGTTRVPAAYSEVPMECGVTFSKVKVH